MARRDREASALDFDVGCRRRGVVPRMRDEVRSHVVHSPFIAAFTPGTRFAQERGGTVEISTRVIGELKVPSGRINGQK